MGWLLSGGLWSLLLIVMVSGGGVYAARQRGCGTEWGLADLLAPTDGGTPGLASIGDGGIGGERADGGDGDPDDDGSLLRRVVSGQARAADVQYAVLDAWSRVRRMGDRVGDRAVELGPL